MKVEHINPFIQALVDTFHARFNIQPANAVQALSGSHYVFSFAQPAPGEVAIAFATDHGITDTFGNAWGHPADDRY